VAKTVARALAERMLSSSLPPHTLLNVNIPKGPAESYKGIRICRQANAKWAEEFEQRTDPRGKDYYWMTGRFINMDHGPETDSEALKNGYVSVVPVKIDFTDHPFIAQLKGIWKDMLV
jgi:5'-nucleotidase